MYRIKAESGLEPIYALLRRLGLRGEHTYFFQTAYAVFLAVENQERLYYVTKWLYPDVARHYDTNWQAVERNIRTASRKVWAANPRLLSELAGHALSGCPSASKFLAILAHAMVPTNAA